MGAPSQDEIAPEEVDELDDIDKVRDDLQSTKQMLALELRNKEAQEMENKRLLQRLANLEAELEKAKAGGGHTKAASTADDKVKPTRISYNATDALIYLSAHWIKWCKNIYHLYPT